MQVTCAIIIHDRKALLCRRPAHKTNGGKWEFPGGKVGTNETAEACIKREIFEELDIVIGIAAPLHFVTHRYSTFEVVLFPFLCEITSGSIRLNEHTASQWMTFGEILEADLCEADRRLFPQLKPLL